MKYTVTIECDNAAFWEDVPGFPAPNFNTDELAGILRGLAKWVEARHVGEPKRLLDSNGNSVGIAEMIDD